MEDQFISSWCEILQDRSLADGGFLSRKGGTYRSDATAWGILSIIASRQRTDLLQSARSRLAFDQLPDGRVPISLSHPETYWPTMLAILGWHNSAEHREPQERAIQFLLNVSGRHWPWHPESPFAHDTSIRGWPWTKGTHSWASPTGIAIIALTVAGYKNHERVSEAKRMLINRQLSNGGWNYGNTLVFGRELQPNPECTGLVLAALCDSVPREMVAKSLSYLKLRVEQIRTPISLGWSLLGLSAWGERPGSAKAWIIECGKGQERYGSYDTTGLALLVLALRANRGFMNLFIG